LSRSDPQAAEGRTVRLETSAVFPSGSLWSSDIGMSISALREATTDM
jgi:hypothetical protein